MLARFPELPPDPRDPESVLPDPLMQSDPSPNPDPSDSTVDGMMLDAETREMSRSRETFIGAYRVEVKIGDGGMGIVYKAVDPRLKRFVALKVLREHLASNPSYLERLGREAELLASLNNPAIVHVHAFEDGQELASGERHLPFLVLEYFEGQSLEDRLHREGRLELDEVLRLIRQAAEGLEAAHARGVIHRDIKPSNLLVDGEGRLKIVDFGLAKVISAGNTLTQDGVILGTPQYISPEQGTGEPSDHRSDLYSLGATFYHLITGRPAFNADSHAGIIYAHVHHAPEPPHRVVESLGEPVSAVVGRLLAKSPADRYQTHRELIDDLDALIEGKSLEKSTESTARKTFRPPRPPGAHRWAWVSTLVAVVALAGLLTLLLVPGDSRDSPGRGLALAPFLQRHPDAGTSLVELEFSQLAGSASPESLLESLFHWPISDSPALGRRPALGAQGLLIRDFRSPVTLRSRVRDLEQIQLRGLLLYRHSTLGLRLVHPGGERVRSLDIVLQADHETLQPVIARRHGHELEVGRDLPPFPPLLSRKCHLVVDLRAAGDDTELTVRIEQPGSSPAYPPRTLILPGADWRDAVPVLHATSFLEQFTTSIEALWIVGEEFEGMDLAKERVGPESRT